jgi:hypothetical protein
MKGIQKKLQLVLGNILQSIILDLKDAKQPSFSNRRMSLVPKMNNKMCKMLLLSFLLLFGLSSSGNKAVKMA